MSPALLSKQLRELEQAGIVIVDYFPNGTSRCRLSEAGEDLRPLIMGLGNWAQRWMESRLFLQKPDPSLPMWDVRRNVDTSHLPRHRCTHLRKVGGSSLKTAWWISAILIPAMNLIFWSVARLSP